MTTLKGTSVKPNFEWLKKTYGDAVWNEILGRLSEDQRAKAGFVQDGLQYDVKLVSAVLEELAALRFRDNHNAADIAFRSMGAYIARDALTGLYSLYIRVAKPESILKRLPTIINTMFAGVTADVKVGEDGRSAIVNLRGLEDLAYAGPRLCGWAVEALSMCGADATVTERNWQAGTIRSNELIYDARW